MPKKIISLLFVLIITACSAVTPTPAAIGSAIPASTSTSESILPSTTADASSAIETPTTSASETSTVVPGWQDLPIVPTVSPEMVEVYQRGLARGRDPNRFSKIGDCQNITTYYLAMFDSGNYKLGDQYAYLQPTIDHFKGSWWRESLAVKGGMNVAAVQNVMWANPDQCKSGETPLQCELRVYNPSIAIISMEESWSGSISNYDFYMRKIVEYVLSQDIVPILATRSETPTQERQINAIVAQIAADYHIPLWNFWASTASLENNGISADGFHLTGKDESPEVRSFFDDSANLQYGWTQRNLTALQAIDAVYRGLAENK